MNSLTSRNYLYFVHFPLAPFIKMYFFITSYNKQPPIYELKVLVLNCSQVGGCTIQGRIQGGGPGPPPSLTHTPHTHRHVIHMHKAQTCNTASI